MGNPEHRYIVECEKFRVSAYINAVDMAKCNQLSKKLFREMNDMLISNVEGTINLDELMITMAMMVHRLAHQIDNDEHNINDWVPDAFPEFCSLIGPDNGFIAIPVEKEAAR